MEPKFQSSFIPKNPVVASTGSSVTPIRTTNIFSIIATIVFILTLLASAGVYFYKGYLNNQIAAANASITAARASFEPDKIQQLIDANARITYIKGLLDNHVALSNLLTLLQSDTVKNIRFGDFSYSMKDGLPAVSIDVNSTGYNALAAQESIFAADPSIQNVSFSDFALDVNGAVKMNFFANLAPTLISYKDSIEGTASTSGSDTSSQATTSTSVAPVETFPATTQ